MNSKLAIKILLIMQLAITTFHCCIFFKIIPYDITWGGRLQNDNEMYVFELLSILIIATLSFTLLIRGNYIRPILSNKVTTIILWIFFVLFALNTIGNTLAVTVLEKTFTVLTFFSCVLIWFILDPLRKKNSGG